MRRHLVQEEARFPAELTRTFKGLETQGNPWGIGADRRDEWTEGLNIPTLADKPDAEYLFFVGCAGSFDDRAKKITRAVAKILASAGLSYAILGKEEPCNGDTARRASAARPPPGAARPRNSPEPPDARRRPRRARCSPA